MDDVAFAKLMEDVDECVLAGALRFAVIGASPTALRVVKAIREYASSKIFLAIYSGVEVANLLDTSLVAPVRPFAALAVDVPEVVIVAADREKERLLVEALPYIPGVPKVIVSGYEHLGFWDPLFESILDGLLVPSIANGYPNSLIHLYQCLVNAARRGLSGSVAEFGVFKGGTSMFLARAIKALGKEWRVYGFDTFTGFPARRSPLDMYDHGGAEFRDYQSVAKYLSGENIELVSGDIADSASRLSDVDLVLTFVDTDNYTSAAAALAVAKERTVVGGAIVFDHFTGVDRFRYTLGERLAGMELVDDPRYFNLHSTGVFLRQI